MSSLSPKRITPWMDEPSKDRVRPPRVQLPPQSDFRETLRKNCEQARVQNPSISGRLQPGVGSRLPLASEKRLPLAIRAAGWIRSQFKAIKERRTALNSAAIAGPASGARNEDRASELPGGGVLQTIWKTIRSKYMTAGAKRLRVGEITSLGEKRFVALISVEGREFLIGGGTAGVSLLTPLDSEHQPNAITRKLADTTGEPE